VIKSSSSNGFSYYLKRQKPKDQRVHLLLVVGAGSLHEEDDQRGVAHFVEHMAFNGTRRFTKQAIIDFFEKSGMTFGSDLNASTGFDRTQYQLSVPTDDPKLLATALDILEDWASSVTFAPESVQNERPIVLSEWLTRQGMGKRVGDQTRDLLLAGSRYLKREPIGDKATLEQMGPERLIAFYQRWYRPERMAIVAVGDIDPKVLEPSLQERFSKLAAGSPQVAPDDAIAVGKDPVAAVITDPEMAASSIAVLFKAPSHRLLTEADYRERLLSGMAAQMLDRRLGEIAQRPEAPFTGASSSIASGMLGKLDLVQIGARAKAGQIPHSLDVLLTEIERVKHHGYTDGELAVEARETTPIAALASALSNLFVTGDAVTSPEFSRDLGNRLLGQITLQEVTQASVERLHVSQEILLASGATRDAMPEKASLLAALEQAKSQPVAAYQDKAVASNLLAQAPTPGSIVSESRIEEVGVTVWGLSNGARVVLKPTDFSSDEVVEQSTSFGGNARVKKSDFPSASFAPQIVRSGGVGEFDRLALGKALAGKVVSVSPWVDELSEGIGGRAAPKDIETMFQLIYLYATAPRRDEPAFEALRASMREQLRNRDVDPGSVFADAVSKKLWGDEPRRSVPTLASIEQIQLDTALTFYADRFADVSDFTFVFVGKIDEATFRPLVERYLASLPGKGRKETFKDLGLHARKGISKVSVQAGKEDKESVVLMFHGESPWSENAHTDLVSLQMYLEMRVREVLREKIGGTYSPRISSNFGRLPFNAYTLSISFECKPSDADKLEQAARDVIADVKKSGIAASYVEKIKSERTRDLEEQYRNNGFWLERLVDKYRQNEDPRNILILHELTKRVTSDNVRLAAKKFLRNDQYLEAKLLPGVQTPAAAPPPGLPAPAAPATPAAPAAPTPAAAKPPAVSSTSPQTHAE
jgi:zinc protease